MNAYKRKTKARSHHAILSTAFALLVGGATSGSYALVLSGSVNSGAGTYSVSDLQNNFAPVTETIGGITYVGVSLWTFLGGEPNLQHPSCPTCNTNPNQFLRNYLVATGAGGGTSLVSIGEIDPNFGGTGQPYLIAYQRHGALLGTPTLIVPQDPTGMRSVVDLAGISVGFVPAAGGPGGVTTQFSLTGVANPATYDRAALVALPATTIPSVTFMAGGGTTTLTNVVGAEPWTLLSLAGIADSEVLRSYLVAMGSDGYQVLFSLGELDPDLGGRLTLVAYDVNGAPLGSTGFARIVIGGTPGDLRGGRFVSNISSLQVAAIPEPVTATMLATGLLALSFYRRRRALAYAVRALSDRHPGPESA